MWVCARCTRTSVARTRATLVAEHIESEREKAQLKFNPKLLYPFDGRASNAGGGVKGLSSTHPLQPLVRCAVYVRNVYIHI